MAVRGGLVLLLAVVLVLSLLWVFQRKLIYFPDATPAGSAAAAMVGARDVTLETADGLRLGAWLVPPQGADRGMAVLVLPGNAGNRAGRVTTARAFAAQGLTVLLVDYRGYGGNPGSPSEEGLAQDALAAHDFLRREGFPAERIVHFGESLGSAVATALSVERPPGGLVLRSPFTELAAVGREHYPFLPVGLLLRDRFPVADLIGGVTAPVVVVYGTADATVPPAQSRAVAARAQEATVVAVEGADHNDAVLFDGPELVAAVRVVIDTLA
ncbi:MAG: alpha/beta hydrolase [Hamadaea sp.]|nr:alpha/beta hydrolase [Hamadaea sp.]